MQKTLLKYTLGIAGATLVLLILHLNFGTAVASVPVSVILYGWLLYVAARWGVRQVSLKNRRNKV